VPTLLLTRAVPALVSVWLLTAACAGGPGRPAEAGNRSQTPYPLRFTDVAADVGLDFRHGAFRWRVSADPVAMMGGGLCWIDYDGDGWLDLFVVNSYAEAEVARWKESGRLPRTVLFRNVRGTFSDDSAHAGVDMAVRGNGCVAADLNMDGHTDLYVTTATTNALLWNNGNGTFTEGARAAGVDAYGWHTGAAVGDVNGDGWPDLFVAGYADLNAPIAGATEGFPSTNLGVRDLLYLSDGPDLLGRVTFREVGVEAGLEAVGFEYGLGAVFTDYDGDGDLDLYVANDTNPNRLYENVPWPGGSAADASGLGFRFEEVGGRTGVADPGAGMGVAAGDFDGDGRGDLFVTNARGQFHAVFGSQSPAPDPSFVDWRPEFGSSLEAATGWGASWADLDLDTDLDLLLVNGGVPVRDLAADSLPIEAFENLTAQGEVGRFTDTARAIGLDAVGPLLARGSAVADFDNDGDPDIAINTIGGRLVLLRNDLASDNWLEVRLGEFAPGAVVTAVLPDGRRLVREVQAGSSYLSSEDPRCLFGLGKAEHVARLTVRWPGGERTVLDDVTGNQLLTIRRFP
jgi:hypothetical protein